MIFSNDFDDYCEDHLFVSALFGGQHFAFLLFCIYLVVSVSIKHSM
jgi:hypothetical protein